MTLEASVRGLWRPAIEAYLSEFPGQYGTHEFTSAPPPGIISSPDDDSPAARTVYGRGIATDDSASGQIVIIEPPRADGSGGGTILMALHRSTLQEVDFRGDSQMFVRAFEQIRQRLVSQFRDFSEIPRPLSFGSELYDTEAAIRELALNFDEMAGWATPDDREVHASPSDAIDSIGTLPRLSSPLRGHLDIIFSNLMSPGAFSGLAVIPLKSRYVNGLRVSSRALYGLLYVYGGHVAAEREIWRLAHETLEAIVENAAKGFDDVTSHSVLDVDWDAVLRVMSVVIDAAALFATATGVGAPAAGALRAVGLGVTALDLAVGDNPKPPRTRLQSFADVMDFIDTALIKLRAGIRDLEGQIEDNVTENLDGINSYRDQYDLTGEIFATEESDPEVGASQITWLPSAADEVASAMAAAAPFYADAAKYVGRTSIWDEAKRTHGIGTSETGPARLLDELGSTIRALLLALSGELTAGAKNVKEANEEFQALERDHLGAISALASDIGLADVAQLEGLDVELDPLASDAPSIPPIDARRLMSE